VIDVCSILNSLATRRPIFHSEADFQHEFAWELRGIDPACEVRLEVPSNREGVGTTDLVVRRNGVVHGIELKYLKKQFKFDHPNEIFRLKSHGAPDQRRYDVLKDIQRLERFNELFRGSSFAIVLTNDPTYWNGGVTGNTIDADFRLNHGRVVNGELSWAKHAGAGSIKGREPTISLAGTYELRWADYSLLPGVAGAFRHLCIEVN